MKCLFCDRKPEIRLKRHRAWLCRDCYPKFFERQVMRAVEKEGMFSHSDRICVAVSGGKDSMGLLHSLKKLGYDVTALFIDLGIEGYSKESRRVVEGYTEREGTPLIVYDLKKEKGKGLPEIQKRGRSRCAVCGIIKRYVMNRVSLGKFDALATGHTLDDAVVFLFSDTLQWNLEPMSRHLPVLEAGEGMVRKVKPLYRVTDQETLLYVETERIPYWKGKCPYQVTSKQKQYKEIWNRLEEITPGIKQNFYLSFLRNMIPHLRSEKPDLKRCRECGGPTTREVCSFCSLFSTSQGP
ncbi:MAG: tRNA(Ile)-lysidine synthetase [Candidatus Aenigmatarchaeota archaeon]|nr:MAG: tRNA(Ile)-lysidine synthetase [Candidatus Aenigmarchaeota archaeon]